LVLITENMNMSKGAINGAFANYTYKIQWK
jgi:hypothetical protein